MLFQVLQRIACFYDSLNPQHLEIFLWLLVAKLDSLSFARHKVHLECVISKKSNTLFRFLLLTSSCLAISSSNPFRRILTPLPGKIGSESTPLMAQLSYQRSIVLRSTSKMLARLIIVRP